MPEALTLISASRLRIVVASCTFRTVRSNDVLSFLVIVAGIPVTAIRVRFCERSISSDTKNGEMGTFKGECFAIRNLRS